MCGICLVVVEGSNDGAGALPCCEALQEARALLALRGPDAASTEAFWKYDGVDEARDRQVGICMASVLHMRGAAVQPQPIHDDGAKDGSFLCWNGEVFAGDLDVSSHENDGEKVFRRLRGSEKKSSTLFNAEEALHGIEGPFAFVYWQVRPATARPPLQRVLTVEKAAVKRLWFGRDPMGRRSLLVCRPRILQDGTRQLFAVSSVAFGVDRGEREWIEVPPDSVYWVDFPVVAQPDVSASFLADDSEESCFAVLAASLRISSRAWQLRRAVHLAARTVEVDAGGDSPFRLEVPMMYLPRGSRQHPTESLKLSFTEAVDGFERRLSAAVERRVRELPDVQQGARVAVLFSGGLDSMVLAGLVDDILPKDAGIDLLNVAFGVWPYDVPDRKTGRISARVLRQRSPERHWRFIEVNVTDRELKEYQERLLDTVWPRGTVMDMTIGPALWFAGRGRGIVQVRGLDGEQAHTEQGNYEEAESLAKVLLLGHGADEQLAGYGRHRNAWKKRGGDGIKLELDKDTARLWIRNLGRDDRVISSLAKESRLPYLDRDLMEFLSALDTDIICDFEEPAGVGDKRILRELARRLRLTQASAFPKRALQFGSRISRLTNSKNGGHVPFEGYR